MTSSSSSCSLECAFEQHTVRFFALCFASLFITNSIVVPLLSLIWLSLKSASGLLNRIFVVVFQTLLALCVLSAAIMWHKLYTLDFSTTTTIIQQLLAKVQHYLEM